MPQEGGWNREDGQLRSSQKKTTEREQQTPAYGSELRTVVPALIKWRRSIEARRVTIETDHATLGKVLKQRPANPRVGYWLDNILAFNIEVAYKPGRQSVVADAISRRPGFVAAMMGVEGKKEGKKKVCRKTGVSGTDVQEFQGVGGTNRYKCFEDASFELAC